MIRWTHSLRTMALVGVAALLCVGCPPAVDGPDEVSRKKVVVHADPPRRRPVPVPVTPQADVRGEADVFVDAEEEPGERPPYLEESPVVVGEEVPELSGGLPDFATVFEVTVPSVVKISTYALMWGLNGPEEQPLAGGTGFFYGYPGEILTNAHVVADAWRIEVTLADGRTAPATLLGVETRTDLALLAVDLEAPPPSFTIMPEDEVKVGLWVMAIGNPLGFDFSASKGIVSAVNRTDVVWDGVGYWDFIQTDAALNQGNSGGPLVDRYGRLVGVCTAVDKEGQRIAYAIPVGMVDVMAHHLRNYGRLRRADLGVQIRDEDGRIAVVGVYPDSPAYLSGFKPGDIIVALDGEPPGSVPQMRWNIAIHSLEEPAQFELERDGIRLMVAVQLEPASSDLAGERQKPVK